MNPGSEKLWNSEPLQGLRQRPTRKWVPAAPELIPGATLRICGFNSQGAAEGCELKRARAGEVMVLGSCFLLRATQLQGFLETFLADPKAKSYTRLTICTGTEVSGSRHRGAVPNSCIELAFPIHA